MKKVGTGLAWVAVFLYAALFASTVAIGAPDIGQPAPSFRLQDQNGDWHTLDDYCGQWVSLYFYPKDDTPGCTTEACNFRDDIFKFRRMGVKILGISLDDVESHKDFAEKYHLPFTLLSDATAETATEYGVLRKFGPLTVAKRQTFLIDPAGNIAWHYEKVDPDVHSAEVLDDLQRLGAKSAD